MAACIAKSPVNGGRAVMSHQRKVAAAKANMASENENVLKPRHRRYVADGINIYLMHGAL